ncbi:mannosylglucosyl-3-phosphoglycerate phosphatase-like [Mya arenaria]|uniref:mannosylglucosyl-3-phosphoglycerate phosphatase-like n=1 Tax=Mya arenaria TaxID=6604 RepID=UPI0022DFD6C4|nr:mannosylglucosyl-3-phosphoglycerate phosphatase-like [Mya arenaria]XP_052816877.1 mannosylglucosyl-3-phosphoglycerate phosphatase-like [Mya arenaria]
MGPKKLTILHFNDVYNVEPQKMEPAGGAARMAHYVHSLKEENPLVLFSGDALNPSLMSIFLKGEQMQPVLNSIPVHCAVYGNHDFDFGVDHLEDFVEQSTFPWLLSNITDKLSDAPLAHGKVKHLMDWGGTKIGLMGLVEEEWIDTLSTIDPADIIFEDFVKVGNQLAKELREEGAELVIALTHMRWPNDRKVAEDIPGVDIVLGGHDHDYGLETVNGKYVLKSGTDFRNMSKIAVEIKDNDISFNIERVDFDSSFPEDEKMKMEIQRMSADIDKRMDEHLGSMGVSMDGRFASIRTSETNLGNFVTDIILEAVPADICMMNSGTFRSDRIHSKGEFKLRDLLTILPMVDPLVVIEITGADVIAALENGVSSIPKLEGRFPQLSGLTFVFDPSKPPGQRVEPELVKVQDEYVQLDQKYRLCTKEYIATGKDGYDMFKDCPIVVSSEQCPTISTAVRNHFDSVQILLNEKQCRSGHRQSLCSIVGRTLLMRKTLEKFMSNAKVKSRSSSISSPPLTNDNDSKDVNQNAHKDQPDAPIRTNKHKPISSEPEISGEPFKTPSEPPEGSPKKKPRTDNLVSDKKAISKAEVAVLENAAIAWSKESQDKYCSRRDSLIGDAAHLEHLAKITQVFTKPLKNVPKKLTSQTSHAYVRQMSIEDVEEKQVHLCPKVEGRIVRADQQKIRSMLAEKQAGLGQHVMDQVIQEASSSRESSVDSSASS